MGLAEALRKRKLGAGGQAERGKRPCAENGGHPAAPPKDASEELRQQLANGGFAALVASHRSKHTRTALRKQRKVAAAAKAAAEEEARRAAEQAERGGRQPEGGSGSESEAEDELDGGLASDRHDEHGGQQAAAPYARLLGSLQSSGGAFAGAVQQRQREQAGDSDASSDEGGDSDADEEEEEEEAGGLELGSDADELAEGSDDDGEEEGEQAAAGQAEANGHASEGSERESSGSEGEDDDDEAEEGGSGQLRDLRSAGQAPPAGPAAAAEDHYSEHFDRDLGEERAAALLDPSRQRARFLDCTPAAPTASGSTRGGGKGGRSGRNSKGASGGSKGGEQGPAVAAEVLAQWPKAALQATEGTRLPQSTPGDLAAYGVKERLMARWREVGGPVQAAAAAGGAAGGEAAAAEGTAAGEAAAAAEAGRGADGDFASAQQRALFALLSTYSDLLLPSRPYPTAADAPDPLLDAVLLHLLSHCAKAADRIKRNNERLKAAAAGASGGGEGGEKGGPPAVDAVPKDQGFTRAKVLLLLPQRNVALRLVSRLLALAVRETRTDTIQNKQRFLQEFGDDEALTEREKAAVARKPAEHRGLFGGNTDDHFRMGIKLTRGAVKLFADFYDSDIIVASPLALATRLAESDDEGAADFLSSVEIVVAERADVMLMQNWAHVVTVFEALNQIPRDGHGVDMMRVRDWALSGWGSLYRQTVLLSSFASAEMNALFSRTCRNHAGKVRLKPAYSGVLSKVIPQARQLFERLPSDSLLGGSNGGGGGGSGLTDADARFDHFKRVLWPRIKESGRADGHLVYLPSYFDYVRVRNFLRQEMASFLGLCEYTDRSDAARARSYFFDRRKRVLLYTERAQFYNRHRIRGAQDILFYQLPEHPQFYTELLNLLEEGPAGEAPTVTVVFSKVDALRLERVVGRARSARMLKDRKNDTFLFC